MPPREPDVVPLTVMSVPSVSWHVAGTVVGGAVVDMLVGLVVGETVEVVEYSHAPSLHAYPCGQIEYNISGEEAEIPLQ
jgi:hypothetical protein